MAIIGLAAVAALALGSCSSDILDANLMPSTRKIFELPKLPKVGSGAVRKEAPVTEADLVSAGGYCAPDPDEAAELAAAAPPPAPDPSTSRGPIDLRSGGPDTPPPTAAPLIFGGIALRMTECQVVRRAGLAQNIDIGADPDGERTALLTYTQGPWPGIYRFVGGRLVTIDQIAPPPKVTRR